MVGLIVQSAVIRSAKRLTSSTLLPAPAVAVLNFTGAPSKSVSSPARLRTRSCACSICAAVMLLVGLGIYDIVFSSLSYSLSNFSSNAFKFFKRSVSLAASALSIAAAILGRMASISSMRFSACCLATSLAAPRCACKLVTGRAVPACVGLFLVDNRRSPAVLVSPVRMLPAVTVFATTGPI